MRGPNLSFNSSAKLRKFSSSSLMYAVKILVYFKLTWVLKWIFCYRFYKVLNTRQKIPVIVHDEDEKLNSNSFVKDTISKLTCDFRNKLLTYVRKHILWTYFIPLGSFTSVMFERVFKKFGELMLDY